MISFQLKRTLLAGVKSLWLHKLRSALTVLGMVFGVCSVIAMLAVGEGASYEAQEQMRQLGSTNIIVRAIKPPDDKSSTTEIRVAQYGLTYDDLERMVETLPNMQVAVPTRKILKTLWNGERNVDTSVLGTVPWLPTVMNRKVAIGRFLSSTDMRYLRNVCVLEQPVANALFPFKDAIGQGVRIGGSYYRVVGIMEPTAPAKAASAGSAKSEGPTGVYIPLTTVRARFGEILTTMSAGSMQREEVEISEIVVSVLALEQVEPTAAAVRRLLERFHGKKDFEMVVPLELLRQAQRMKRTSDIVLGSIAAISLLVGGIGIMNIMLASVTERTREIGIRRALGAKKRHIISQFLTEAALLSGFGGVVGVLLGIIIPFLIGHFAGMTTIVTFWAPALAFSISVMIGVAFGIYPAYRAAEMDPIEALRHE